MPGLTELMLEIQNTVKDGQKNLDDKVLATCKPEIADLMPGMTDLMLELQNNGKDGQKNLSNKVLPTSQRPENRRRC